MFGKENVVWIGNLLSNQKVKYEMAISKFELANWSLSGQIEVWVDKLKFESANLGLCRKFKLESENLIGNLHTQFESENKLCVANLPI